MHLFSSSEGTFVGTANSADEKPSPGPGGILPGQSTTTNPASTTMTTSRPAISSSNQVLMHQNQPRKVHFPPNTLHLYTNGKDLHIFGADKETCLYTLTFPYKLKWVVNSAASRQVVGSVEQEHHFWTHSFGHYSAIVRGSRLNGQWSDPVTSIFTATYTFRSTSQSLQGATLVCTLKQGLHRIMECRDGLQKPLFQLRANYWSTHKRGSILVLDERMKDGRATDEMIVVSLMFYKYYLESAARNQHSLVGGGGAIGGGCGAGCGGSC